MTQILMPRATAVWLVENTALTFEQISTFTGLHLVEIEALADGEGGYVQGLDPVIHRQLSQDEISRCEQDSTAQLAPLPPESDVTSKKRRKVPRYVPLSKRADKPDGIAWLVRHHPELLDSQIIRLIGTTKNTIKAIRTRTHWNSANIKQRSPVEIGLCTQKSFMHEVDIAIKAGRKTLESPEQEPEELVQWDVASNMDQPQENNNSASEKE